jgi:putative ABC transport system permease protein
MQYLFLILKSSFEDFRRNKVRTLLTSLGILIGVSSVVLLIAFGLGLKAYIKNQFQSLGTNLVIVMPGNILQGGSFRGGGNMGSIRFDEKDVINLKKVRSASYIVPVYTKSIKAEGNGKSEYGDLYATTADIFPVRNLEVEEGRLFDKNDVEKRSKYVCIGPKIAQKLFDTSANALNKIIKVENQAFRIIGVLKPKGGGGFGGPDLDSFIYMPYKTAFTFNPDKNFFALYFKAENEDVIPIMKEDIKNILLRRYKDDEFSILEQTEILNAVSSIFSMLNLVLVAIATISLIVGGIGIMNIMYVSVTERTREIGIRRAIGAKHNDILFQFLAEAVILSLFGGIMGITLSFGVILLIRRFFPVYIDLQSVMIAVGVSSLIGIIFGVFPARKAAKLSPIEAIRYE